MVFLLYSIYPLSFCDKKGEYFFVLDLESISKPVKFFLFQNGQRENLLVFYAGNILIDKNTLCNGCILNRFISFIQSSSYMDIIHFKPCDWSQVSRRCP
jgi:hypothetical protein